MKVVALLRHGKSSWDEPSLADHDRPLAPRGREASRRIGVWAAAHDVRPELVLCSTATRARATLDLIYGALGSPPVELEQGLYHASAADLMTRLRVVPETVAHVLLVGHNPGLLDLLDLLAAPGSHDVEAFPTGALATLELDVGAWQDARPGCASVTDLALPRSLR